ncbi:hypothetical protein SRHO_G00210560, partial [Serrasalmus rhombeus]
IILPSHSILECCLNSRLSRHSQCSRKLSPCKVQMGERSRVTHQSCMYGTCLGWLVFLGFASFRRPASWRMHQIMTLTYVFVSQVEKNEEADQEIKQDGTKPEDKAHKAATKIQASFRGHIIRKKMKDDGKEEDSPAAPEAAEADAAEASAEAAKEGGGEEEKKKEEATSPATEKPAEEAGEDKAKSPMTEPPANSPAAADEGKAEAPAATSPSEPPAKQEAKEDAKEAEKPGEAPTAEAEKPTENVNADKKEEEKAEAKQADVPAAASETADCEEANQTQDNKDAADDSKPADGAVSEAGKEDDKDENA